MRVCARCQAEKALSEFPIKNAARGLYRSYCQPCCRGYAKEHYRKNVAAYMARSKVRAPIDRKRNRGFGILYSFTECEREARPAVCNAFAQSIRVFNVTSSVVVKKSKIKFEFSEFL